MVVPESGADEVVAAESADEIVAEGVDRVGSVRSHDDVVTAVPSIARSSRSSPVPRSTSLCYPARASRAKQGHDSTAASMP